MSFFHAGGGGGDLLFKIYGSFYLVVYNNLFLNKTFARCLAKLQSKVL